MDTVKLARAKWPANFRQVHAETAGNRYLRRFLLASAGYSTCGTAYLQPSQVNLTRQFCSEVERAYESTTLDEQSNSDGKWNAIEIKAQLSYDLEIVSREVEMQEGEIIFKFNFHC